MNSNSGFSKGIHLSISKALPLLCAFAFVLFAKSLTAAVVINEVLYDPVGNDPGYEWIELYNNGSENVELEGAQILAAGQTWAVQYTLPAFTLRPGRYLLIGGTEVLNAQLTYNFSFQNVSSESDGIRYICPDGSYTDTVLYGSPNSNLLSDDSGYVGTSFAVDAPPGSSLARIIDGFDTDASGYDFIVEANPSPGLANPVRCDYAIGSCELSYQDGIADLTVWLKNNSYYSPVLYASFSIRQVEELYNAEIPPIAANDSVAVHAVFACQSENLSLELSLSGDPQTANNTVILSPTGTNASGIIINEFLADPESGNQEWIELYAFETIAAETPLSIKDASGNITRFTWNGLSGYAAVCRYKDQLLARYPSCPEERVIEASSWASLNNDGDSLILDSEQTKLDSISYTGSEIVKGISRERYLDANNDVKWRNSLDAEGGTPGQPNSTMPDISLPEVGSVQLSGSPCKVKSGEKISVAYNLPEPSNRISCSVFDLRGKKIKTLADYNLVENSGVLHWDGSNFDGSFGQRGLYVLLWESQSTGGGKIMRKQLTAVLY